MSGARSALIVATNSYDDRRLARLDAPARDAEELAAVLGDPDIGGFEVTTVLDRPSHEVSRAVAQFFRDRRPDDLVLLHLSCHGLKDDSGELYFAATDTSLDLLEATALPSSSVNRVMERSRAGRVLLFLDCCYSGAFARGMTPRAGGPVDVNEQLGGRGRAVITASSAMQYAFEGDRRDDGEVAGGSPSLFTRALVDGLRSGEADRDLDGWVSLDELYAYVHDEVTRDNPDQTPRKWAFDIEGDLRVARRGAPVTTPAELSDELRESMASQLSWERAGVVDPLAEIVAGPHPGRALAARQALEEMATHDDSERVRAAARQALSGVLPAETPRAAPAPPVVPPPPAPPPPAPSRTPRHPRVRPRWSVRRTIGAAGAAALLVVAALTVWLVDRGGPDDGGGQDGADALPASSIVTLQDGPDGPPQITAVHPDGVSDAIVENDALTKQAFPALNGSRDTMVYLDGGTPRLVQDIGADPKESLLFPSGTEPPCARMSRVAWSPQGALVAFVCTGVGLYVVTVGLPPGDPVYRSEQIAGSPMWGGDDRIYIQVRSSGRLRIASVTSEGDDLRYPPIGDDEQVKYIGANWGLPGLLYIVESADGEAHETSTGLWLLPADGASGPTRLSAVVPCYTAWSPDARTIMWAVPTAGPATVCNRDDADVLQTWSKAELLTGGDTLRLGSEAEIPVLNAYGPPAWARR